MEPILIISGTNRPGANALRVAKILQQHYQTVGERVDLYSLHEMPAELFNPSSYGSKPPAFAKVQDRVVAAKGIHLVTPEYNGGFPGVLKYFIDMLKFPESFDGKPVAFVGEAAGIWGAFRPVEQLQHIFGYRNAYVFPERVFIPRVNDKLDADGRLNDPMIDQMLQNQVQRFIEFANRLTRN